MKKWVLLSLIVIFFLAVFMRLFPLTRYAIWGSDAGEYYSITNQLISDGYVSTDYDGWGFGYPYFPGMFYFTGAAHFLTGLDLLFAMIVIIPVVASISVFIVFIISRMLFKNDGAALLASGFLAVAMPHVFATSHPMPGSLGDMLLLSSLLFLLASLRNNKFIPLLILSTIALIITHHLSSYFLFIMIFGGFFLVGMLGCQEKKQLRLYWAFLVFFFTVLVLYWMILASRFAEGVVSSAFDVPFWVLFIVGYVVLFLVYVLIVLRRRISWSFKSKFPEPRKQIVLYIILLGILFFVLGYMALVKVPGTNINLTPETALLFSPLIIILAFTSAGAGYLKIYKNGVSVYGWIVALVISLLVAIVTSNRVLFTYRHPQYFMAPLALAIGIGVAMMIYLYWGERRQNKALAVGLVVVLLGLTSLSAYPPRGVMGGFQEGTSEEDMQAVAWAKYSLEDGATVATDHRMSSMVFGFAGQNATWDAAIDTLHGSSYEECKDEIDNISTPSGEKHIDYVILDDDIKDGVALLQWENAEPMRTQAWEKFEKWPFVKLYEANGVEVYGVVG
ncbi:MAG: hypothetical protein JSW00_15340 [Thermoplasmata archaeon]|nr:MAG: hypothetical protein JSW00_15340 [Thermoplasmata archaeon]